MASKKLVDQRSFGHGISICEVDALRGRSVVVTNAAGKEVGRAHVPDQGEADKPEKPRADQGGVPGTCRFLVSTPVSGPEDAGPYRMRLEGAPESEAITFDPDGANQIEVRDLG